MKIRDLHSPYESLEKREGVILKDIKRDKKRTKQEIYQHVKWLRRESICITQKERNLLDIIRLN